MEIYGDLLAGDHGRVFPCPHCREMIDTLAAECRFCHSPVDPAKAEASADLMDRVNKAMSEFPGGEFARKLFLTPPRLAEVVLFGFIGMWLVRVSLLLVFYPILLPSMIAWRIRYGTLKSDDAEFLRAKQVLTGNIRIGAILLLILLSGIGVSAHWPILSACLFLLLLAILMRHLIRSGAVRRFFTGSVRTVALRSLLALIALYLSLMLLALIVLQLWEDGRG